MMQLRNTVEAACSVQVEAFFESETTEVQEIIYHQHVEPTIKEMIDEVEEEQQEEMQEVHEVIQPGEPTTQHLTEVLTMLARPNEQIQE